MASVETAGVVAAGPEDPAYGEGLPGSWCGCRIGLEGSGSGPSYFVCDVFVISCFKLRWLRWLIPAMVRWTLRLCASAPLR